LVLNYLSILKGGPLAVDNDTTDFEIKRQHPLIWHTNLKNNINNGTNDLTITCRNSIQGKVLIVDERGYICLRSDLLWTGCCNIEVEQTKLYSCDTCIDNSCCSIYEQCVSCCLNPDKVNN